MAQPTRKAVALTLARIVANNRMNTTIVVGDRLARRPSSKSGTINPTTDGPPPNRSSQARASFTLRPERAAFLLATKYFTPSIVRYAVKTEMRIGAVWSPPTWETNAASSTTVKGAATNAPGTAANTHVNAKPSGTLGISSCTSPPAVPPMNSDGNIGPPINPLP